MPIRAAAFSNIEEKFLLKSLGIGTRVDKREMLKYRSLRISYGLDYGCCTVDLGNTKVMAQVACVLDRPKESRPNEGRLIVHVEMSTIAFPTFDPSKPGNLGITIQRMLERSLLLSRAVDLEELCVRVGEKVWSVHLYVHVLSHDGNIIDCSFIAAVAALKHFRRPDITIAGKDVTVHSLDERNPLPLTFHHIPLCISFAFFNECDNMAVDPTYLEEKVMDGVMMICMNKHGEMCSLQMSGEMRVTKEQILRCAGIATSKVKDLTGFLIQSLEVDITEKKKGKTFSYSEHQPIGDAYNRSLRRKNKIPSEDINIAQLSVNEEESAECEDENETSEKPNKTHWMLKLGDKSASIGTGNINQWLNDNQSNSKICETEEKQVVEQDNSSSSEDENIVVMKSAMLET